MVFNSRAKTIYVSYIADDTFYAETVAQGLRDAGYTVALTPQKNSPRQLNAHAEHLIGSADAVVLISSPTSVRSDRFWRDSAVARINNTPLIPLVVHEFTGPVPKRHYVKATDDIQHGIERLEAALHRVNGYRDNSLVERERPQVMRTLFAAASVAIVALMSLFVSS